MRARGERADVDALAGAFEAPPQHERAPVEVERVTRRASSATATATWMNAGWFARAVAPRPEGRPGRGRRPRTTRPSDEAIASSSRSKEASPAEPGFDHHAARGVGARSGQLDAQLGEPRAHHRVGHREQDPRAVAAVGLCARRSSVLEVLDDGEREVDDLVGCGRRTGPRPRRRHRHHGPRTGRTGGWASCVVTLLLSQGRRWPVAHATRLGTPTLHVGSPRGVCRASDPWSWWAAA